MYGDNELVDKSYFFNSVCLVSLWFIYLFVFCCWCCGGVVMLDDNDVFAGRGEK